MDDLLLCSLSQASSQESRIYLLKLLVLTGCKIAKKKKKLAVCPNPGSILRASDMRTMPHLDQIDFTVSKLLKTQNYAPTARDLQTSWLMLKLDSKFISYGQISVCFTKQ